MEAFSRGGTTFTSGERFRVVLANGNLLSRGLLAREDEAEREVLNAVQRRYFKSETLFELRRVTDANSLIHYLRAGMKAETAKLKRLQAGLPAPEDLE